MPNNAGRRITFKCKESAKSITILVMPGNELSKYQGALARALELEGAAEEWEWYMDDDSNTLVLMEDILSAPDAESSFVVAAPAKVGSKRKVRKGRIQCRDAGQSKVGKREDKQMDTQDYDVYRNAVTNYAYKSPVDGTWRSMGTIQTTRFFKRDEFA